MSTQPPGRHATRPAPYRPALTRQGVPGHTPHADASPGGGRTEAYGTGPEALPVALRHPGSTHPRRIGDPRSGRPLSPGSAEAVHGPAPGSAEAVHGPVREPPRARRLRVLPPSVAGRAAVGVGRGAAWYRFTGDAGRIVSLGRVGPGADTDPPFAAYGITSDHVAASGESPGAARG